MNRTICFFKRNLKEVLRDSVIYIFCLLFPIAMLLLFNLINSFSGGHTPTFEVKSIVPGIITFSYTFITLTLSLLISKDRQTSFLKRLYSSPMKSSDFIFGYAIVGVIIGLLQTIVCVITGGIITLFKGGEFISLGGILLLIVSQLPILIFCVFLGVVMGTLFSDKSAPGITSVLISASGILGGSWMPIETMGGFETFCKFLPFYPSVYLGRITAGATNALNALYTFDGYAVVAIITIFAYMLASIILTIFTFKKNMVSDN
jgi:ABC-2 type transport system permease protein